MYSFQILMEIGEEICVIIMVDMSTWGKERPKKPNFLEALRSVRAPRVQIWYKDYFHGVGDYNKVLDRTLEGWTNCSKN